MSYISDINIYQKSVKYRVNIDYVKTYMYVV